MFSVEILFLEEDAILPAKLSTRSLSICVGGIARTR